MNYLDSSALVKLVHSEPATPALRAWLRQAPGPTVSSALAAVEVTQAIRRGDPAALPQVPIVLARITLVPIEQPVLASAAALRDPLLRSLDALHLATAIRLESPALTFVTYDKRLAATAHQAGLATAAPC